MKNKRIIAVAMATGMAVSLAACGGSASTTDTTGTADAATTEAADAATGEGTGFTVQLGPNPETLDPALNAAVDGGNTLITIEEPLLIIDENNEIQPGQAESYEVSDDGLVWTFHLRDGLKWSDGSDLTAKDFEYSFKRLAGNNLVVLVDEQQRLKGGDDGVGTVDSAVQRGVQGLGVGTELDSETVGGSAGSLGGFAGRSLSGCSAAGIGGSGACRAAARSQRSSHAAGHSHGSNVLHLHEYTLQI